MVVSISKCLEKIFFPTEIQLSRQKSNRNQTKNPTNNPTENPTKNQTKKPNSWVLGENPTKIKQNENPTPNKGWAVGLPTPGRSEGRR